MGKKIFWRIFAASILAAGLIPQVACSDAAKQEGLESITVYKSPTCGCCSKWVSHLQANGFEVEAIDLQDMKSVKAEVGISRQLSSCHTAKTGGYVIEGHVPVDDIKRLLKERPDVAGLTVPGMPMGSPGMEGHRKDNYDVLTFTKTGETAVFSRH
jgi:hypothetical protein